MRFLTAGESHGQGLTTIIEGMPAGLKLDADYIAHHLWRRQQGFGRGGRMKIESDRAEILSGVRFGKTLGSPIALVIRNKDWVNWQERMSVEPIESPSPPVEVPRPGHADLAGMMKYDFRDLRNILERASARETAARVAVGAVARRLLEEFGMRVCGYVTQIGPAKADLPEGSSFEDLTAAAEASPVRCPDEEAAQKMIEVITEAKRAGDTVGGVFEVAVTGVPVGLGSHVHWDRRLDGRLAQAVMSIQAVKGVDIGLGFETATRLGSAVHDEIALEPGKGYLRYTNHAGGLEGGISNGEPVVVRAMIKPISTLMKPLRSVNIRTKETSPAHAERSDVCVVPPAVVVGEAMAAIVLAEAFLVKFGGDSVSELRRNFDAYQEHVRSYA
ncbi:MAG: chorismate synthase [Armatimonadetes bacterium]|nr:chorismate synthase [Armatimonadota bacterium]